MDVSSPNGARGALYSLRTGEAASCAPLPPLLCSFIRGGIPSLPWACRLDWPLYIWTLHSTSPTSKQVLPQNKTTVTSTLKQKKVPELSVCIPGTAELSCCAAPEADRCCLITELLPFYWNSLKIEHLAFFLNCSLCKIFERGGVMGVRVLVQAWKEIAVNRADVECSDLLKIHLWRTQPQLRRESYRWEQWYIFHFFHLDYAQWNYKIHHFYLISQKKPTETMYQLPLLEKKYESSVLAFDCCILNC